ncbi:hypothetical protein [Paenibacillus contaminans]|uniref:Uncharacterized protein n=1 Tax=Paenibacillus contaminans TaxID=450362 RepID=A0A329MN58_9BACL|nr:hypothetical protein [Paenibacillus contaminans]RAV21204.1 hypothetical protein DQG23_11105 [Paenibacillus contaminans]
MITDTVYVHVRHWLFWYGVYGFCDKSCNDEITLYSDKERINFLGYFDLLTQPCLIYSLNNELDKIEDNEFCNEIEEFIRGNKDIVYSYIYPRNEEDISHQVVHFAPLNDKGHKPTYIYVFSKLSKDWDMMSIERMVKILANDFLHLDIEKVVLLDIPTYEETKVSYDQDYELYL